MEEDRRIAVIVDGARGYGAEIALALADVGFTIAVLARESCETTAIVALARRFGGDALGVAADFADAEAVEAAIDEIRDILGAISVLVDPAGLPSAIRAVSEEIGAQGGVIILKPGMVSPDIGTVHARIIVESSIPAIVAAAVGGNDRS
jgi:NAD(P)-dependent dehydrogenase (short-subunit alcohol dehydrogenase family)